MPGKGQHRLNARLIRSPVADVQVLVLPTFFMLVFVVAGGYLGVEKGGFGGAKRVGLRRRWKENIYSCSHTRGLLMHTSAYQVPIGSCPTFVHRCTAVMTLHLHLYAVPPGCYPRCPTMSFLAVAVWMHVSCPEPVRLASDVLVQPKPIATRCTSTSPLARRPNRFARSLVSELIPFLVSSFPLAA